MSVLIAAPYGQYSPESGLLYLFGRYLARTQPVQQLVCNGVLSACELDVESNWRRSMHSCFNCMSCQGKLGAWSEIASVKLSQYISSTDFLQTSRWINSLSNGELLAASFEGVSLNKLITKTFAHRFGIEGIDFNNKQHERYARQLMLNSLRALVAGSNLVAHLRPDLILMPLAGDFFNAALREIFSHGKAPLVTCSAEISKRCVVVTRQSDRATYECPLIIEDVLALRPEVQSWSPELLRLLGKLAEFLGCVAISSTHEIVA